MSQQKFFRLYNTAQLLVSTCPATSNPGCRRWRSEALPHVVVVEVLDHLVDQPRLLTCKRRNSPYSWELPSRQYLELSSGVSFTKFQSRSVTLLSRCVQEACTSHRWCSPQPSSCELRWAPSSTSSARSSARVRVASRSTVYATQGKLTGSSEACLNVGTR